MEQGSFGFLAQKNAELDCLLLVQVMMNCGAPGQTSKLAAMTRCHTVGSMKCITIDEGTEEIVL